jgi:hypothetical protein
MPSAFPANAADDAEPLIKFITSERVPPAESERVRVPRRDGIGGFILDPRRRAMWMFIDDGAPAGGCGWRAV